MRSIRSVNDDIVKEIGEVYEPNKRYKKNLIDARLLVIAQCHYPLILGVDNLRHMGNGPRLQLWQASSVAIV